MLEILVNFVED